MLTNKKKENDEIQETIRENWNVNEVADEASNQLPDEILRQFLRGDESRGDANARDVVGSSETIDTQPGR